MIDNEFSQEYQYYKGQYCVYNKTFYRAKNDIPVGTPFSTDNWEYRQIGLDLYQINNNTIDAYGIGTHRFPAVSNAYGYITASGNNLYLNIPINIKPEVTNINISELLLGLRVIPGGYAGGTDNFNALSYISAVDMRKGQSMIMIYLIKQNGWGATNNTPAIGSVTITFTLS